MERDIPRETGQGLVAFVVCDRFYFLSEMGLWKRARTVGLGALWPGT